MSGLRLADGAVPVVSSDDRDAWLAARRTGVTATEVRDIRAGYKSVEQVAREKFEGKSVDLSNVPTVAWGNFREDAIAEELERRYAIAGNRTLFRHYGQPRHLATPDGIGSNIAGEVVVSEIKTSSSDLTVGGAAFVKKGYGWQVQWQMYVMGAVECCFAWERHDNDFSRFAPRDPRFEDGPVVEPLQVEWIDRDDSIIAELIRIADAVLAAVDTLAAGEELEVVVDEELDTAAVNYLRGLDEEKRGKALKEQSFALVKARMESGPAAFRQRSAIAQVSWPALVVEHSSVTVPPRDEDLPADVREQVARERELVGVHEKRAVKARERLQKLLAPHSRTEAHEQTAARRPTITAVKAKNQKEKAA